MPARRDLDTLEVGSVPDKDPVAAARAALELHPGLPSVPELPRRDPREGMLARVLGGLDFVADPVRGRLRLSVLDPALASALDAAPGAIPPSERAAGLHAFLRAIEGKRRRAPVKAAVVGPVALARALRDPSDRGAAAVPAAADAVARFVARGARSLAVALRTAGVVFPVIQLDEPGTTDDLSSDEARRLADAMRAVREAGALVAVHDCGSCRADALLALAPDLLLVDATGPAPPLLAFPAALRAFLEGGGNVAWGIVPTRGPMPDGRAAARALLDRLAAAGIERGILRRRSWLSPACGLGASTLGDAAAARAALAEARAAWT